MPTISPTIATNEIVLQIGENKYYTTLCAAEFGGMDSYIEQTEGWLPACARVYMTAEQWAELPEDAQKGITPISIGINGNASIPNDMRVGTYAATSPPTFATKFTAEIFYVWRMNAQKAGTTTSLYEVQLRTQQQWWDAINVTKAWNALDAAGTAFTAEEGATAEFTAWEDILKELWADAGIKSSVPPATGDPTITNPLVVYSPLNLRLRGTPFSVALRRVLDVGRMALSHDLYTNKFAVNPVGKDEWIPDAFANDSDTSACYLLNGDKAVSSGTSSSDSIVGFGDVVPAFLTCLFPIAAGGYTTVDTVNPGPNEQGLVDTYLPFHVGDVSQETLDAALTGVGTAATISAELAANWFQNALLPRKRYLIPGHAWPILITDQTDALGGYMHPAIRYRKVSVSGVRAFDMAPGISTYIEIGPLVYETSVQQKVNSPILGGEVMTRWRPDGTIDILPAASDSRVWISITGRTAITGALAWKYNWKKINPTVPADVLVWEDASPAVTQESTGYGVAFNSLESNNPASLGGSGTLPIGVPLPQSGTLQPFGDGAVFPAIMTNIGGVKYPIFTGVNSITC